MKGLLFLSTTMMVSSSSLMVVWASLELNALCMCFMISKEMKKNKEKMDPAAMYFLIQSVASIILLWSLGTNSNLWAQMTAAMMILMKMGGWPLHTWYLKVIPSLSFDDNSMKLVMTWQKVGPLFLMLMLPSENIVLVAALATLVGPTLSLSGLLKMKPLMTLSSVSNSGWMILSLICSPETMLTFLFLYSSSLVMSLNFLCNNMSKEKITRKNFFEATTILGNMGGLPPLMIFSAKVLVINKMVQSHMSNTIMVVMMFISCAFLYFYCWALSTMVMVNPEKSQNLYKENPHASKMIFFLSALSLTTLL
uniref:NADH dehydrogenase subunit 2 n=1 Tax=Lepidoglyphus destructor TaxID=36936 RepID=UPI001FF19527|nr:NADH dehydrogenase subunit 2 [Lepidoglyphus destructor]UOG85328.1 NADH dehydrogenase subunit 2 [Lepidoglyphus destructor]